MWLSNVALIAIIGFLLQGALSWEHKKTHVTWMDMALLTVGADVNRVRYCVLIRS
jgi:hypothetical protein